MRYGVTPWLESRTQVIIDSDMQMSDMDGAMVVRPQLSRVPSNEWLTLLKTAFMQSKNALLNNAGLQAMAGGRLQYVTSGAKLPGGSRISERAHEGMKAVVAAANELAVKHNAEEDESHRQTVESVKTRKEEFEQAKKAMIGR
jgi:hypothetical protein